MKRYVIKRIKDGKYLMRSHQRYTSNISLAMLLHSVPDGLSQHEKAVAVEVEIKEKGSK